MASLSVEEENYVRMSLLLTGLSPRAVRCKFDKEFVPAVLSNTIKREFNNLFSLKGKKVINQAQWNVLHPKSGVPDSKDFDITLMICLLRNLVPIPPPMYGFDCLPSTREITAGADLARIKYYRNFLAHLDGTKIDAQYFTTAWTDVSDAIGRLGGLAIEQECKELKVKILDQSNKEILLEIKQSKEEIKELKEAIHDISNEFDTQLASHIELRTSYNSLKTELESLKTYHDSLKIDHDSLKTDHDEKRKEINKLKTEQEDVVPRNIRENMNLIIQQWRLKDNLFVETSGSKALRKELRTVSVAIVTGSPGTGKSSTAQHTLLSLNATGYDIIPVTSSADMVRYSSRQHRQAFYIDNLCGKYNISSSDIEEWERNKDRISDIFTSPLTKCLFTCRSQIYQDPIFSNLNLTNVKVFDLSGSHQLTLDEKMSVGRKYLQEDILKCISNETIKQSECFPLLCSLYDKHSNESTLFFEKPKSYFETELDELKKKPDKLKYACIALCVVFDDKVTDDIFTKSADVTTSNRLKVTLEESEINASTPKKTIISQFESMVGTYFQKSETGYKSIHDYMFDIYCSHVSISMLQCVIEHADSKLLSDRALLQSLGEDSQEFTIIIPPTMEIVFFNRIKEDIKNNKIWDVYSSRQLKYESYQSKLISFLQQNDDIINNANERGMSALYVTSRKGYSGIVDMLCNRGRNVNQCTKDGYTPLYTASFNGHTTCVDVLLNRGADVNKCNYNGASPLLVASGKGYSDVVNMLCNRGGNVSKCSKNGYTPLHAASQEGHSDIVDILCNKGGNANQCTKNGRTPLYTASFNGHKICVDVLLNRGADVNTCNNNGVSALYVASQEGHSDIVDLLCNRGGNVNKCTKGGYTPLHAASQEGHSDIVDMLCNREGNVNQCTKYGRTPLYVASRKGHSDIVDMLSSKVGNVNQCTKDGCTPLLAASRKGKSDIVDMLCNRGGNVNQCTKDGRTPLYTASFYGHRTCVDVLLNRGAEVNACNNNGTSPLNVASKEGHSDIVDMLCNKGGNVNQCDKDGCTPLFSASFNGHKTCVDVLLNRGADVNICNNNGLSALYVASQNGHSESVDMLCTRGGNVNQCTKNGCTPLSIAKKNGHDDIVDMLFLRGAVNVVDTNRNNSNRRRNRKCIIM